MSKINMSKRTDLIMLYDALAGMADRIEEKKKIYPGQNDLTAFVIERKIRIIPSSPNKNYLLRMNETLMKVGIDANLKLFQGASKPQFEFTEVEFHKTDGSIKCSRFGAATYEWDEDADE